ncbi:MAG: hypothetical protein A2X64_00765 [Ignavibacteria bacterium GWF2_33_9]|nr:MAG: hypothetical protein A2X64_00765 [Ignavibacteria bacterium GWF2_33_9]
MNYKSNILIILIFFLSITFAKAENLNRVPTVAFTQSGKWHIYDENGKDMFKPLNFVRLIGYSEDFFTINIAMGKDTLCGFMTKDGKIASIPDAKLVGLFKNGFAQYVTWYKGTEDIKRFGYVRNDGVQITKPIYLEATVFGENGLAFVMNWEKRGYIDESGNFIKEFSHGFGEAFSEGKAVVQDTAGKFGFIDENFKIVIPLEYDEAHDFHEGLSRINKDALFGYIDTIGLSYIPPIFILATDFKEGRAFVAKGNAMDSLHWAILSHGGKILTEYQFDQINDYSQGIAAVKQNGKWFYVDLWGKKFIERDWKYCDSFVDGIALAFEDGGKERKGYINIGGDYQFLLPKDAENIIDLRLNKAAEK